MLQAMSDQRLRALVLMAELMIFSMTERSVRSTGTLRETPSPPPSVHYSLRRHHYQPTEAPSLPLSDPHSTHWATITPSIKTNLLRHHHSLHHYQPTETPSLPTHWDSITPSNTTNLLRLHHYLHQILTQPTEPPSLAPSLSTYWDTIPTSIRSSLNPLRHHHYLHQIITNQLIETPSLPTNWDLNHLQSFKVIPLNQTPLAK